MSDSTHFANPNLSLQKRNAPFATLLQDANVDPLIRQITLGHQPQGSEGALGMTTVYTHTRPETQAREIERAWRTWPSVLSLIADRAKGGAAC